MQQISNKNVLRRSTAQTVFHSHQLSRISNHRAKQENSSNICVGRIEGFGLIHEDMNAETGILL